MKKFFACALDALALALLAGVWLIRYYAARRLGMVRWLNYQNRRLLALPQLNVWLWGAAALLLLLSAVLALCCFRRGARRGDRAAAVLAVLLALWVLVFSIRAAGLAAYYLMLLCLFAAELLLLTRTALALRRPKT